MKSGIRLCLALMLAGGLAACSTDYQSPAAKAQGAERSSSSQAPALATPTAASPAPAPVVAQVDYATQVKPIFEKYCYQCHGHGQSKGGVRLDVATSAMVHITPGDPWHSDVSRSIIRSMNESDHMPPFSEKQPSSGEIVIIWQWIAQGANGLPPGKAESAHE